MPVAPQTGVFILGLIFILFLIATICAWLGLIVWLSLGYKIWSKPWVRRVPWGGWSVLGVIGLNLGLQIAAGFIRQDWVRAKGPISTREMLISVIGVDAGCLILIPLFLRGTSRATAKDLGLRSENPAADLARGLGACLLLAAPVYGLMALLGRNLGRRPHPLEDLLREGLTASNVSIAILTAVAAAPLTEELIFRGVILGWLCKIFSGRAAGETDPDRIETSNGLESEVEEERAGARSVNLEDWMDFPYRPPTAEIRVERRLESPKVAESSFAFWMPNVLTSLFFAALHFRQWPAPIPLFFFSLGLGYLAQRSGNLISSIVLHASFNGISTAMLILAVIFHVKPS